MKIFVPAWHYRARAIVQRIWGWSPIEEMVFLALDRNPATMHQTAASLKLPNQVVAATVARLMQFGLIEVRLAPQPTLTTSSIGRDFIRSNKPLPERKEDREIGISLIYEKVGHSVFRNRDVETVSIKRIPPHAKVIEFPLGEPPETDSSMADRVYNYMAGTLRPGEWLRGTQSVSSVIEKKYLVIDLNEANDGILPESASDELINALSTYSKTGNLPIASSSGRAQPLSIKVPFRKQDLVLGSEQQLELFERIAGNARTDIFVLSTFVASQSDKRGDDRRERIWRALEEACQRGVRCHLFFGTALDDGSRSAIAMQELAKRLSSVKAGKGFALVHRDSVKSHAKIVAADDGEGGAVAVIGSCNWLSSPFSAVELSVALSHPQSASVGLDALRSIISSLASSSRSVETLQFISSELKRNKIVLTDTLRQAGDVEANLTILHADDHERYLRRSAHEARLRFICCTNRMGSTMVPGVFNPAEAAGRRLDDVRIYYSRQSGPIRRRHVAAHRERLKDVVKVIGVREPQLHAKFLAWDENSVIVSSLNWGSQSGLQENPFDEIGVYLDGPGVASDLLRRFETELSKIG